MQPKVGFGTSGEHVHSIKCFKIVKPIRSSSTYCYFFTQFPTCLIGKNTLYIDRLFTNIFKVDLQIILCSYNYIKPEQCINQMIT